MMICYCGLLARENITHFRTIILLQNNLFQWSHLCIQWNMRWENSVMRGWPPMRDHFCSNMALHFYTFVPLINSHLSYKTTSVVKWGGPHHRLRCTCMLLPGLYVIPSHLIASHPQIVQNYFLVFFCVRFCRLTWWPCLCINPICYS